MLYLISNSQETTKHIISYCDINNQLIILDSKNEIFNLNITKDDILILSLDIFNNTNDVMAFVKSLLPSLKIIALRDKTNLAEGTMLVKKGVKSYFQSNLNGKVLQQVIPIVKDGNTWVYPQLMNYIIKQVNINTVERNDNILEQLTPKEREVALLVASGNSNNQIGQSLDIALVTVKKHIGSIFEKLDIKDRVSLSILINKN